jgi:NADPH:quinone reductase-like Zn-dependent oxidoreductase
MSVRASLGLAGAQLLVANASSIEARVGVSHVIIGISGFGLRRPRHKVLGMDVAGRVLAVGRDVKRPRVGDAVYGMGTGTFAEFAVAHEDRLVAKPRELSFVHAAAATVSGLTAWQAVHEVAKVHEGQRVLVLGASGGVGSFAVQLAHAVEAEVTGVASAAKLDVVASLGAAHLVDYAAADPCDGSVRYDVILDVGGRTRLRQPRKALTPTGTLVIIGGEQGGRWTGGVGRQFRAVALSPLIRQRLTTFISAATPERLNLLRTALQGGTTPLVERTFPLDQVPHALNELEAGRVRGKAVVDVRPQW